MTRKEELDVIIDRLRDKLINALNSLSDKSVSNFVNSYRVINDLNDQINKYVNEYRSL